MKIFVNLAPFAAFASLMLVTSASISLFVAAALALAVIVYDLLRGASVKMLMAGAMLLFAALGCYDILSHGSWSSVAVRVAVDCGVLTIALLSIAFRAPFTLQYARENVDRETAQLPGFKQTSYVIAWAWTAALVLMLVADILTIYLPSLPLWVGVAIAFAARNSAVYFTRWYPKHRQAKYGASGATTVKS